MLAIWALILSSKDEEGITKLTPKAVKALWSNSIEPRPLEDIQAAWNYLSEPDPDSAYKEYEGRRIIPTADGRWKITAHEKYRQRHSGAAYRAKAAARQQRFRDRQAGLLEPAQHHPKKHNFQEGQQDCLKEDLEKGAEELPDDQATPQETHSQASVAVAFQPPECFLPEVPVKAPRTDLVARGCDIWTAKWGAGSAPNGEIAGTLPKLAKHHGEEVVLTAFQRYATENTHPSPSPSEFKKHFSDWLPTGKGAGRAVVRAAVVRDVEQENRDSLARIKAKRGEE